MNKIEGEALAGVKTVDKEGIAETDKTVQFAIWDEKDLKIYNQDNFNPSK